MACRRIIWCVAAFGLCLFAAFCIAPGSAAADAIPVALSVDVSGGYARLVFDIGDDIDATVRVRSNVLIVGFSKPILISLDHLPMQAPAYIGAARRDPDGKAIRFALERKVRINSIIAGEKFFVDLLPDTWRGAPPPLPRAVIDELARRVREAARLEQRDRLAARRRQATPVRVRVATEPTFTRYVFAVPAQTSVSSDLGNKRLTLTFNAPIKFDLADAEAAPPGDVAAIRSETGEKSTRVRFGFIGKVDVHTFRDDKSYLVDVNRPDRPAGAPRGALQKAVPARALEVAPADETIGNGAAAAKTVAKKAAARISPAHGPAAQSPPTPSVTPGPDAALPMKPPAPAKPAAGAAAAKTVAKTAARLAAARDLAAQSRPAPSVTSDPGATLPMRPPRRDPAGRAVVVELSRQGAKLKLSFPFSTATAAAVFQRADTLWMVFDARAKIDLSALDDEASRTIRTADFTRAPDADIVRLHLDRPHLASVDAEGPAWTVTIGESIAQPVRALEIARDSVGSGRASAAIPFVKLHELHRIADPEIGDQLLVVTGFAPARGFINERDFVEFHVLASTQGMAVEPLADDLEMALAAGKVVISRPGGLVLSNAPPRVSGDGGLRPVMFDSQLWHFDLRASYDKRQSLLIAAAAAAPAGERLAPRLDLARFYIARGMYPEAKGVLDVVLAERLPAAQEAVALVLRALADVMMNRPAAALKDLTDPSVGDQHDAPLWRGFAYAQLGKWAQAREAFKSMEAAIATLPIELARLALRDEMRAAIEVGDFVGATDELDDLETIGVPRAMQPAVSVLVGRLREGTGRTQEALADYGTAADSWDRPAAAQARLRETLLRYKLGNLKREDVVAKLETLTTIWRGDETEIEALQMLARLYTEQDRYRDAFYVMRSAMAAHPNSDLTRRIQADAATTFESLFLTGKGDALSPINALALFYDFRELVPIDERGDEMIRRLADRLVSLDLLDQAADLLQYQLDRRLQGAARAQVATGLAAIYLMDHRPDRALAMLRATYLAGLPNELRDQRLLLEARALSDLDRHDLALEVIADVPGRAAIRLRSDIFWAAKRWRESAEQIELYYGERWKQWQPLNQVERSDLMRAAIGYALAGDTLGLGRFRDRYAAKMAATPDARVFEIVAAPLDARGSEFRDVAHAAVAVDTLESFLRDMQKSYPQVSALPPATVPARPNDAAKMPSIKPKAAPSPAMSRGPLAPTGGRIAQRQRGAL